ncbi:hypothetical protein ABZP36_004408 [Zizania latifolia]
MDFHTLPRRDLQALCKRNGVRANMTNVAMAEALASLPTVDGLEEFVKEPTVLPVTVTKSAVKAVVEEVPPEKKGRGPHVTVRSPEIIRLDDSDEEEKKEVAPEEKAQAPLLRGRRGTVRSSQHISPDDGEEAEKRDLNQDANEATLGEGRRGVSRRARAAPVVAPTTIRRTRASTIETVDAAAEAETAPAPRRRAQASTETAPTLQSIVAALPEEKVPRGTRTTRRAAARMPRIQSEEEEEHLQGVVSPVETNTASVSDAGSDDSEEVDREPLWVEQNSTHEEPVQEEEETVENKGSAAHKCLSEALAEEQEVDVEQPFGLDDSPILGLVSGTASIEGEEAPVCNNEGSMDKLVAEDSCDIISEEKETMPVDEVPEVTVTCSEATVEGIGGEASAETVDNKGSVAHKCLSEALADEQEVDVEQPFSLDDSEELDREPLWVEQNSTPEEPVQKEEGIGVEASAETVENKGSAAHKCLSEALAEEQEVDVEQPLSLDDSEEADKEPLWVEQNSTPEEPVQQEEGIRVEASAETVENKGSAAHKCLSEALAEEQKVDVEQPFSRDDSPILGLVSGPAAIEEGEEAPVCNNECSMDKLVAEESCDTISEEKETMPVDEVPEVTVTCSEATVEGIGVEASAETVENKGSAAHKCLPAAVAEEQEVDVEQPFSLNDSPFLGLVSGPEAIEEGEEAPVCNECSMDKLVAEESCDIVSEEKETMPVDEVPEATVTCSEATVEAEFPIGVGSAIKEGEAVNGTGVAAEDNGAETADEPHNTLTDDADNANSLSYAVEEVVVATEDVLQSSTTMQDDFNSEICHADEHKDLITVERVSSDKEEDISEENVSGDLPLKFDGPGYLSLGDHSTDMFGNVADSLSTSVIAAEATVSETVDMPSDCMHSSSSSNEKRSTELVAKEDGNEVILKVDRQKEPVELTKLSLSTLRAKLKEKLVAKEDENEVILKVDKQKEPVELTKLSLGILRAKLKEKLIANKRKDEKRVALARLDENVC